MLLIYYAKLKKISFSKANSFYIKKNVYFFRGPEFFCQNLPKSAKIGFSFIKLYYYFLKFFPVILEQFLEL